MVNACFQVLATQPHMCTKRTKFHAKQQVFNNYYQASQTRTSSRITTEPSFPDLLELHERSKLKFISKNIRTPLSAIPANNEVVLKKNRNMCSQHNYYYLLPISPLGSTDGKSH